MGSCEGCPSKDTCKTKGESCPSESLKVSPRYGKIKNVIGVISGKGGVGKSTVTGIMATMLAKKGYKVGVLDADITGPSMPRFFGINKKRALIHPLDNEMVRFDPVETDGGIKVISMNLVTPVEEEPLIWRGAVINGVLKQLFVETNWGELDYLLIDMPPGTGDIALTVMQEFPIDEIVIVSTPQDMVSMIVKKVVIMAQKIGIKIKGVVENMAYINCPDCDKKIRVFSRKSSEENAEYLGLPLIGELPINIELTEALEDGKAEEYVRENALYSLIFEGLY
ncbi:Mrp/NBP35 family ATP-binding protein [Clostridium saccharobutylicum]|uniref:Iron-sulfur cluster carrier protein n=2 Tax=Clostridium saccharobutylicum TaxID=169679 RepID=U5MKL8_CLOSA|nr:Mrp/NBP35 family ATP-binding protein [Clostridium saccharobutylicum]AGX41155.1 protein Mrp [Clostridium saccharobutylicum DSM 13864]AQR88440.1 flagellum site-determining protein YlxH [Clostridium saccharobutylicum]AQR98338.1 flagellum site-determining protein YlxH [Clostridium saccharobutylicum]AQS08047.1 flagellum site-determining protein YlxH [Clostridium saccharobutylicum]AQS12328.1 flagellum site-determining protein YlxH [Clostridium saccharobutylicum]